MALDGFIYTYLLRFSVTIRHYPFTITILFQDLERDPVLLCSIAHSHIPDISTNFSYLSILDLSVLPVSVLAFGFGDMYLDHAIN